jgi:hypothetical protein
VAKAIARIDDDDDEEATEFLAARPREAPRAPSSGEAVPRAQGRAVSIEYAPSAMSPLAPLPAPVGSPPVSSTPALEAVASLESVVTMTTAPEPIRPLPQRTLATDVSATGTRSTPRVTRIQLPADGGSITHGDDHAAPESTGENTLPPQRTIVPAAPPLLARRLATHIDASDDDTEAGEGTEEHVAAVKGAASPFASPVSSSPSASASAPRGHRDLPPSAEAAPILRRSKAPPEVLHDGVLVVDAPPEATVTVNGVERGRGTVKVSDLDREARHAVRIQCPGFVPWKGSVSLQGKTVAKIRPALKPRVR